MMSKSAQPKIQEIKRVYKLLGECCETGTQPTAWRNHLIQGLRKIINARVGLYMHIHRPLQESETIDAVLSHGFMDDDHLALWQHYHASGAQKADIYHKSYFKSHAQSLHTRRLYEVVNKTEWYKTPHYNEYIRACELEDRITTSHRLDSHAASPIQTMVFHRDRNDGDFPLKAKTLIKFAHIETARLLKQQRLILPGDKRDIDLLPARMQQILELLLDGYTEKEISTTLSISRYTVNRHVQRLYQHFNVNSRSELNAFILRPALPG